MPVVGTAGHVDHGKTALILALTGIDTDRLPEEKARGMTTDLGFAHFEAAGLGRIGVVDVPGHERFIRNMVAGAASVDAAVLVVAADDGWMDQSTRHLDVLRALGVPVLAVAVTKADLVARARAEEVGADAARRVAFAFAGRGKCGGACPEPPALAVDALRGSGVAELRLLIAQGLARLGRQEKPGSGASLDIDRVFTLRRAGLVVAGTLRGGSVSRGTELLLLPAGEKVRVRELQSYGLEAEEAVGGSRVALAITHPREAPRRGDRLVLPGSAALAMRSFYASVEVASPGFKPRPGFELELAIGSAHREARAWPSRSGGFLRVALETAIPASPGERLLFLRTGGADVLCSGRIVAEGGTSPGERSRMEAGLSAVEAAPEGRHAEAAPRVFRMAFQGFLALEAGEAAPAGAELAGDFAVSKEAWAEASAALLESASRDGGLGEASLAGKLRLPEELSRAVAARLVAEGRLIRRGGILMPAREGEAAGEALPASARKLLSAIETAGQAGYERPECGAAGSGKDLSLLCGSGLVLGLDSRLFLAATAYEALIGRLLAGRGEGSLLSVPDAKEATGFSRKWILPFLNRAERDGWVRREGDLRRVLAGGTGAGDSRILSPWQQSTGA